MKLTLHKSTGDGVRVEFIALQCYFSTSKQNYPCFNTDKFDVYIGYYYTEKQTTKT